MIVKLDKVDPQVVLGLHSNVGVGSTSPLETRSYYVALWAPRARSYSLFQSYAQTKKGSTAD